MASTCTKCGLEKADEDFCKNPRSRWCKACWAAYMREYSARRRGEDEYRERRRAQGRKDAQKRRETRRDHVRQLDHESKRRRRNDEFVIAQQARSRTRARVKKAGGVFVEHVEPLVVLEMDDGVCQICHKDIDPFDFELDHIIPLSRGGEHSYANVQLAHPPCNQRKHNKILEAA